MTKKTTNLLWKPPHGWVQPIPYSGIHLGMTKTQQMCYEDHEMKEIHKILCLYHPTDERNPWYSGIHLEIAEKQQISY